MATMRWFHLVRLKTTCDSNAETQKNLSQENKVLGTNLDYPVPVCYDYVLIMLDDLGLWL